MALVYLIPAFLLAAGSLLLASRERVVKTAGAVLMTAGPLLFLWMGEVMRKLTDVTPGENELSALVLTLSCVYVTVGWIWFFVSLRRLQKEEDALLSSAGRQGRPAKEPRELDWRRQPPPGAG